MIRLPIGSLNILKSTVNVHSVLIRGKRMKKDTFMALGICMDWKVEEKLIKPDLVVISK